MGVLVFGHEASEMGAYPVHQVRRPTRRQVLATLAGMGGVLAIDRFGIDRLPGIRATSRDEDIAYATPSSDRGRAVPAQLLLDFSAERARWEIMNVSAGPAGDPIALLWERPLDLTPEPDEAELPGVTMDRRWNRGPNRFRVLHVTETGMVMLDIDAGDHAYSFAQPLAGEGYLLVESWPRDGRPNADVYSAGGAKVRSFALGGGIGHVQVTSDNRIWVGFFDQGVIEDEVGQYGVICFDADGDFRFRYNLERSRLMIDILDCYALNATDDETWLFTYVDFPLSRVRDDEIDGYWEGLTEQAPIAGAGALAVSGERLLFASPYDAPDNLFLVTLGKPGWHGIVPVDEAGTPLTGFRTFGRGSRLYLWNDSALRAVDLAAMP